MSGECEECGEHCLVCRCGEPLANKWTNIRNNLPHHSGYFLVIVKGINDVLWGEFDGKSKWRTFFGGEVTHWMSLPKWPKNENFSDSDP